MKKFLIGAALAASAFVAAAPAAAAVIVFTPTANGYTFTVTGVTGPNFADSGQFTAPVPSTGSVTIQSVTLTATDDIDFTTVTLNGVAFNNAGNDTNENFVLNGQNLLALNTLNVSGTSSGNGTYNGIVVIASNAVPEPATWAMMIGGFGIAGAAMRRGRKTKVVTA